MACCTLSPFGLAQIANFREVAPGTQLLGGQKIRAGSLYRAAQLNYASSADIEILRQLGLKTYIDLREPAHEPAVGAVFDNYFLLDGEEMAPGQPRRLGCAVSEGVAPGPNASYQLLPQLPPTDPRCDLWTEFSEPATPDHPNKRRWVGAMSPNSKPDAARTARFLLRYNIVCLQVNAHAILRALQAMIKPANYPLVFGCVTGKDRTGFMAALVLVALGASREQVMADYLESSASLSFGSY